MASSASSKDAARPSDRNTQTVRAKLIRTAITTLALVTVSTLTIVAWRSFRAAQAQLSTLEGQVRDGITARGRNLVENQSGALASLAADNAFGDIEALVRRTLGGGDREILYGLFLGAEGKPWVYLSPTTGAKSTGGRWTELGRSPGDLLRAGAQERVVSLYGQAVFEFGFGVQGGDALLGTVVYGISGGRLTKTLAETRARSRSDLISTLVLLGVLGAGGIGLGFLLTSSAAARITHPIVALTRAAQRIAAGEKGVSVDIDSGDEIETLARAFNQMNADRGRAFAELEVLSQQLEQRVKDRTRELDGRNRDMRLVLDNVAQGLLTLDMKGQMSSERSAIVAQWFGRTGEERTFSALVRRYDRQFATSFELALEQLSDAILPIEACLSVFPGRIRSPKQLRCEYKCIEENGDPKGLLVVITDITELLERERRDAEQRQLMALFLGVQRDRSGLVTFMEEADRLIEQILDPATDIATLKRAIHTLKGNAALAGLTALPSLCHRMEDQIEEHQTPPSPELNAELSEEAGRLRAALSDLGVTRDRRMLEVDFDEYHDLVRTMSGDASSRAWAERLLSWQLEPAQRSLERLGLQAQALATRLGKGPLEVRVDGGGIRLEQEETSRLFAEMVHLVRNAVDHGFETPVERDAARKPSILSLRLSARQTPTGLEVTVQDDGRGIDWETVRSKAKQHGRPAESAEELLQTLLLGGISTKDEVSDISGRGQGVSALYHHVKGAGGTLTVASQRGTGTSWTIVFPLRGANATDLFAHPARRPPMPARHA